MPLHQPFIPLCVACSCSQDLPNTPFVPSPLSSSTLLTFSMVILNTLLHFLKDLFYFYLWCMFAHARAQADAQEVGRGHGIPRGWSNRWL